jgi:hypothetical protein
MLKELIDDHNTGARHFPVDALSAPGSGEIGG